VFYGNQRNLEYDFVGCAGSRFRKAIALTTQLKSALESGCRFEGRTLILSMADGQVIFQKPVLYQM